MGVGLTTTLGAVTTVEFNVGKARSVFEQLIIKPINSTNAIVSKFDFFIIISF